MSKKSKNKAAALEQTEEAAKMLKSNIRNDIRNSFVKKGSIDNNAIIATYLKKFPKREAQIRSIVTDYANAIEDKAAAAKKGVAIQIGKKIEEPKPVVVHQKEKGQGSKQVEKQEKQKQKQKEEKQAKKEEKKNKKKEKKLAEKLTNPIQNNSTNSENINPYPERPPIEDGAQPHEEPQARKIDKKLGGIISTEEHVDESHAVLVQSTNAILNEFKEHLATQRLSSEEANYSHVSKTPDLEHQLQFLSLVDENENATSSAGSPRAIEHSVLVSPMLEDMGNKMPSQFGLLGHLVSRQSEDLVDPRVMLNTNIPFSAFICGLQGSGKSHTTSCMIENCSLRFPALGTLKKPLSTLVLHYNEYSSNVSNQPSEAAFLASTMPEYNNKHENSIPVRVLTSPSNFYNLEKMYSEIPRVSVHPFRLQPRHLNIATMLSLMSMGKKDSMPLYMAQLTRILREMALVNKGQFNYVEFRRRLKDLRLDRSQTPFLEQRLDLLDSFLDLKGTDRSGDYFVDGGVTILDLSCPFMDQDTACVLFRIAIDLFLHAHPSRGKLIVADEAHKYMTNTEAANALTETFLNIIRQQRHLGTRIIISTQEPTISPRLIDLCSVTIVHRFSSPEWYQTIKKHISIGYRKNGSQQDTSSDGDDGLYDISSLRTGEALVFAPSAYLLDGHQELMDVKNKTFKMVIRKRVTWDGGQTIKAVR